MTQDTSRRPPLWSCAVVSYAWFCGYCWAFADAATASMVYFVDGLPDGGERPDEADYVALWQGAAVGVAFAAVAWLLASYFVARPQVMRPRPVSAGVVAFAAGVFGTSCALCMYGVGVLIAFFDPGRGESYMSLADSKPVFVEIGSAISAGVGEEFILVGALVAVVSMFGTGGRAFLWCVGVSVVGRVAFHMYYGPAVLVIIPWAVLSVWVYWRFRSWVVLLVMMVMHAAADLTGGVSRVVYLVVSVALLVVGWRALGRSRAADGGRTRAGEVTAVGDNGAPGSRGG